MTRTHISAHAEKLRLWQVEQFSSFIQVELGDWRRPWGPDFGETDLPIVNIRGFRLETVFAKLGQNDKWLTAPALLNLNTFR